MELRNLLTYSKVCEAMSFSKAADELGYAQSTVTMQIAQLEEELLESVNALGIGPQGFGGRTTALAVNIEQCPTHIAGLPVAVNINCHVTRHMTEVL